MKFISWNVNGLRACKDKGFMDAFKQLDAGPIGTMPRRKAIRARPFIPATSRWT